MFFPLDSGLSIVLVDIKDHSIYLFAIITNADPTRNQTPSEDKRTCFFP